MEQNLRKEPLGKGFFVYVTDHHTFGTDAVLLSSFANARKKDKMVDLYGATYTERDDIVLKKSDWDDEKVNAEKEKLNFEGRPTYDDLKNAYAGKSVIGNSHNVMLTFGVIFNFTQTYKGLIIEY